jgi:adenine phosphoribosyltransferase
MEIAEVKSLIRDVPDFPKKGIVFKDITPVLGNGAAFRHVIDALAERYRARPPDRIVSIESRGFLFGAAAAYALGCGLAIVRKPGKLPWKTDRVSYQLEYGTDSLEAHVDAVKKGERVVVVDDVLATGGTAAAVAELVRKQGAELQEFAFAIELDFLHGRDKLGAGRVFSLIHY